MHTTTAARLTASEQAFHAWYYAEGLSGMQRAREAAPGSEGWAYEQATAFNREWTASAWAQRSAATA